MKQKPSYVQKSGVQEPVQTPRSGMASLFVLLDTSLVHLGSKVSWLDCDSPGQDPSHGMGALQITCAETTADSRRENRKSHSFPLFSRAAHKCSHLACLNSNRLQGSKTLNFESEIRSFIFKRKIKDLEKTTWDLFITPG